MATAFKIETGVPMPSAGRPAKYPFGDMQVGASFLVTGSDRSSAARAAYLWGSRHGTKFATRKDADGLRIWRIA